MTLWTGSDGNRAIEMEVAVLVAGPRVNGKKKPNSGLRSGYKSISAPNVTSTCYKRHSGIRGRERERVKIPMTELLVGAIVWCVRGENANEVWLDGLIYFVLYSWWRWSTHNVFVVAFILLITVIIIIIIIIIKQ